MSTPKVVAWRDVRKMLDSCAKGWTQKDKLHHRWIDWNGLTCPILPLGKHTKRKKQNYEVQSGKVRNLVWTLEIDHDCATKSLGLPIPKRP